MVETHFNGVVDVQMVVEFLSLTDETRKGHSFFMKTAIAQLESVTRHPRDSMLLRAPGNVPCILCQTHNGNERGIGPSAIRGWG